VKSEGEDEDDEREDMKERVERKKEKHEREEGVREVWSVEGVASDLGESSTDIGVGHGDEGCGSASLAHVAHLFFFFFFFEVTIR